MNEIKREINFIESERKNTTIKKKQFIDKIINGLGDEIKNNLNEEIKPQITEKPKNKLKVFLNKLFNL